MLAVPSSRLDHEELLQFRDQNDWAFRSNMNTGFKRIEPGMDIWWIWRGIGNGSKSGEREVKN